ncbi:MAG: diguanylate cyclase [Desulfobacterium sp.]|jgi:diguanylate cyclase (GGDEF)-like protein|nr:diguanylate cyclase [Desulfobacterium sp.]
MTSLSRQEDRQSLIRSLFDEYIEMYASRDDRLTEHFSENFSGYAGSSDLLVKDKKEWIKITGYDFAQVPGRVRIEMLDLFLQDISDDVVVVTAFFHIHLPLPVHFLARETARLVLIFRLEGGNWKIVHSGISIPFGLARDGEVYPMLHLQERNRELETLVEERTQALKELNDKLDALSNTDGLTGIANRRNFDYVLAQEWNRGKRAGTPLALIMVDADLFKHFNDHYGHMAGDDCLRAIAQVMTQTVRRAGDLVARYGGEEFVVLLPRMSGDEAMKTAENILHEVRSLALPHAETFPGFVTVSLGVASLVPSEQHAPEDLLSAADAAMYLAKQSGRNCLQMATN